MIPSFLKPTEAQKILLIGKSINFLREVCHQVRGFYKKSHCIRNQTFLSMFENLLKATF